MFQLNRQVVVPCVLRLHHEAATETKRLITAGIDLENPTADEFEKFQINVDEPIELLKVPKEASAEEKPIEFLKIPKETAAEEKPTKKVSK